MINWPATLALFVTFWVFSVTGRMFPKQSQGVAFVCFAFLFAVSLQSVNFTEVGGFLSTLLVGLFDSVSEASSTLLKEFL